MRTGLYSDGSTHQSVLEIETFDDHKNYIIIGASFKD